MLDAGFDLPDDTGIGLLIGLAILFLPVTLTLVLLSVELVAVLALIPFLMSGQLLGLLPWVLVLRGVDGSRRAVDVRGIRPMLEARRYYRSLRV